MSRRPLLLLPVLLLLAGLASCIHVGFATHSDGSTTSSPACRDTFDEAVEVLPLGTEHALVSLEMHQSTWLGCSPTTFPQAVRRLAAGGALAHLNLALTRGRWDYQAWGVPPVTVRPPGAEVAVRWSPGVSHTSQWPRLQHRLSGLMCASLNLLASPHSAPLDPMRYTTTTAPPRPGTAAAAAAANNSAQGAAHSMTCSPGQGGTPHSSVASSSGWHVGVLPREAVCTENLTPWLQLLPCRGEAGLAAVLADRQHVLSGAYHSLSLEVQVLPSTPTPTHPHPATPGRTQPAPPPPRLRITQRFTAVLRLQPPTPAGGQQQQQQQSPPAEDGSSVLFSRVLPMMRPLHPCLAADTTHLRTWHNNNSIQLLANAPPSSDTTTTTTAAAAAATATAAVAAAHVSGRRWQRSLGSDPGPQLAQQVLPLPAQQPWLAPALALHAALLGTGLHTGQLQLVITQLAADRVAAAAAWPGHLQHQFKGTAAAGGGGGGGGGSGSSSSSTAAEAGGAVCLQLSVPWVMRLWLHTLQLQLDGQEVSAAHLQLTLSVEPARDRGRPAGVLLCLHLPRTARRVALSLRFSRAFLTLQEHLPDAHRGWDLPPSRLHYVDTALLQQACERTGVDQQNTSTSSSSGDDDSSSNAGQEEEEEVLGTCGGLQQVLGPGLLLRLATADVAMPYNVICLTSTVLAVFLGATLNTLTQRGGPAAAVVTNG